MRPLQLFDLLLLEVYLDLHFFVSHQFTDLIVLLVLIRPGLECLSQVKSVSSDGFVFGLCHDCSSVTDANIFPLHKVC